MRKSLAPQKPRKNLLALAGTCLLFSSVTEAQIAASDAVEDVASVPESTVEAPAAATVAMAEAAPEPDAAAVVDDGSIAVVEVTGRGSARTKAAVAPAFVEAQVPGLTPQALLADLPGVNIQVSDPFGMYELNERMLIRGFESSQLGMTVDGVPFVASLSEGGTIAHYVLTENLAGAEVSPGAGDVSQPAVSALGGAIRYISKDPSDSFGGQLSGTTGRFGFSRLFAKLDSGRLWENGPSAYIAAQRNKSYQWEHYPEIRGFAGLDADHFEGKIKQKWGYNSLTLKYSYDRRSNWDTENINVETLESSGANVLYQNPTLDPTLWHGYWRNGTDDTLVSLHGDFFLTENLNLKTTAYYNDHQYWLWYGLQGSGAVAAYNAAMAASPGRTDIVAPRYYENGEPVVAQRVSERGGIRKGGTAAATWNIGAHTLEGGAWYELNDYTYFHPIQNTDPTTGAILRNEVTSTNGDFTVETKIFQPFLKGTVSLFDNRLVVQAGAKALQVKRELSGYRNASDFNTQTVYNVASTYSDWFQPQAGFTFDFTDSIQAFANYAENFSAVTISALSSVIYNPNLKPERSENIDFGVRFKGANWSGFISAYTVKFEDRIIGLSSGDRLSAVQGTTYLNVDGVNTKGLEISGDYSPIKPLKLTTSWSYSDARYADNYFAFRQDAATGDWIQDVLVPVKDNKVPGQPRIQGNFNAFLKFEHFSANLGMQYMGKRYGDSLNQPQFVPPNYTIWNAGVSWSGLPSERLQGVTLRVNAYNLFDKKYVSTLNTNNDRATGKRGYPRAIYWSAEYAF